MPISPLRTIFATACEELRRVRHRGGRAVGKWEGHLNPDRPQSLGSTFKVLSLIDPRGRLAILYSDTRNAVAERDENNNINCQLEIPLTLGLPTDLLTMILQDGQYTTQVELRVAATDEEGNGSEIPVIPLTLSAPRPPRPGGFVRYDTKLKLQGAAKRLVVAVYDPLSGKIATAQVEMPGES